MFERFMKVRYIAVVIVILALLHAMAFLAMGTHVAVLAYRHVFDEPPAVGSGSVLELLHSLDFMFISMVLLVLALGIAKLSSDLTTALFAKLQWTAMVMPSAIVVLSLSLYFMKKE